MAETKDSPLWWPMFALPNVQTTFAIEVDGFALVPHDDFRLKAITKSQPRFGSFMKKFKNEFGNTIHPSVIIWRKDKTSTYRTIGAISGFRDLVSLSVVPIAWARSHRWSRAIGAMYSDAFAVYPWMVDNKGEGLITSTPTMLGYHEVRLLRAQTMPALSTHILNRSDVDFLLLTELLKRWERCFSTDTPSVGDERLFRSLNMANAAAKLPASADTNLYDTLRATALWASAFEILRPARREAYKQIYTDLDSIPWNNQSCREKLYEVFGEKPGSLHSLPIWLFGEITRLRNDTLHGNPLRPGRLIVPPGKQAISMYAAPLYRMMLVAYLDLKLAPRRPTGGLETHDHRQSAYETARYQQDIEVALGTVMVTDEEHRQSRQRKTRQAMSLIRQVAKAVEEAEAAKKL